MASAKGRNGKNADLSTGTAEDSILARDPVFVSMRLEGRADHAAGHWTSLLDVAGALQIRLTPHAGKQYLALGERERSRLLDALEAAGSAHAVGKHPGKWAKPLGGSRGTFRLWVGNLRVVYDVLDIDQALLVLAILDRSKVRGSLRQP